MSFLPIILIILYLLNSNGGIKELLGGLDVKSIAPLLSLFGVNEKALDMLSMPEITDLISGKGDIKALIPLVSSLVSNIKTAQPKMAEMQSQTTYSPEYLNPIKDVASKEIYSTLYNYFQN